MSSQYLLSSKQIEHFPTLARELAKCDAHLRAATPEYPFEWLPKAFVFAITLPPFDEVDDWGTVLSAFEEWYHPIAVRSHADRVDAHLAKHSLQDIIRFRGKGSMHHRFGVSFASFALRLEHLGFCLTGSNRQKSAGFWKALEDGQLSEEQVLSALRTAMLPPAPNVTLPQTLYGALIRPAIRPCYIDFQATLRACGSIAALLEHLFVSARMSSGFYFDVSVDKNALNKTLDQLIVLRSHGYLTQEDAPLSTFVAPSLYALLVFLFKQGLITIPTVENAHILFSLIETQYARHRLLSNSSRHRSRPPHRLLANRSSFGEIATQAFQDPLTDYILSAIQKGDVKSVDDATAFSVTSPIRGIVTTYNALPRDDCLIAVYTPNADGACTYGLYDGTDDGYHTLFNRTDKVVALPSALATNDVSDVLHHFIDWATEHGYDDSIPITLLAQGRMADNYPTLYGLIEHLADAVEATIVSHDSNLPDPACRVIENSTANHRITKDEFIAIGDLLLLFLWLHRFILLPSHTRALALSAPIRRHVRGVSDIFDANGDYLTAKYLDGRSTYLRLLERGLCRAITASNPVGTIDDIHEGQFELIFAYGYSHTTSATQCIFRRGIRGIVDCLSRGESRHRLNANRLKIGSINKRLPRASDDIWLPWQEAGLPLWHHWLHTLARKSDRLLGKTTRAKINRYFLAFLHEYSQATGEPVPESPFGITPRMIVAESNVAPDFQGYVLRLELQSKSAVFSAAKHIFDVLQEHFPSQWSEGGFVHPFPRRLPFRSKKRNTTHRRPIESLHLDAIKNVLLCPDEHGRPTFHWVKTVYSGLISSRTPNHYKRDVLFTNEGPVWWPGNAVCLAFLLEVPLRGMQARWLDEGCLDDELFSLETLEYAPNSARVDVTYPDGKRHADKYKSFNGKSGVIQQRPASFMDSVGDNNRGPALFINTNKTSVDQGKFDQGYFIPWPYEDGMNLPYWLIQYMMEFNQRYDPSPTPISFAYEGEMSRAESTHFIYSFTGDAAKLNQYPFVTPLFRDLTKDPRYTRNANIIVFDKDGNEMIPPLTHSKLSKLLNAVAVEAEKRLLAEGYPRRLACMTNSEGKIIYDLHTLRVTGVSRLMALGVPIEVIRDVVGHAVSAMTYYYSVFDQFEVMTKLREGLSVDVNRFSSNAFADGPSANTYFPNIHADPRATIQYGGWVERNGGICPSGVCDEGGPAIVDDDGNTVAFTMVPGGPYRCGNCRLWMSGPRYIPQQAHFIDLLMHEIVELHEDRLRSYESKVGADTEIAHLNRSGLEIPQSLFATSSGLESEVTQLTERLSYLWMEWRNRYLMIEASIASLDKDKDELDNGSLVLFTGHDSLRVDIQRHYGSQFGLKREIANSIIYHMPISHEVRNVLNSLERSLTKLQVFMSANDGKPLSISQILDDDLRNRAIAMHAQHLHLILQKESGNADQRVDRILADIQQSLPIREHSERSALQQWHKAISESLKDMIELPSHPHRTDLTPLKTKSIDEVDNDE